jgi:hypothetical protein
MPPRRCPFAVRSRAHEKTPVCLDESSRARARTKSDSRDTRKQALRSTEETGEHKTGSFGDPSSLLSPGNVVKKAPTAAEAAQVGKTARKFLVG